MAKTPLLRRMFGPPQPQKIGMWGLFSSGKTTYVASLYIASLAAKVSGGKQPFTITPTNKAAIDLIDKYTADLIEGLFPPATNPEDPPQSYEFDITVEGRPQPVHLTLIEAAGGHVLDRDDKFGYFRQLRECSGLLMMIDPDNTIPKDNFQAIFRLVTKLREEASARQIDRGGQLTVRLATCISKIDIGDRRTKDAENLLEHTLGTIAYNAVNAYFPTRRAFKVSAVGMLKTPDGGCISNIEHTRFPDEQIPRAKIRNMNEYRPICILQPILWLLNPSDPNANCEEVYRGPCV